MPSKFNALVLLTIGSCLLSVHTQAEENAWNPWQWVQREYREFRIYPRVDRAYRLMSENAFEDARQFIIEAQAISPNDHRVNELVYDFCRKVNDRELCTNQDVSAKIVLAEDQTEIIADVVEKSPSPSAIGEIERQSDNVDTSVLTEAAEVTAVTQQDSISGESRRTHSEFSVSEPSPQVSIDQPQLSEAELMLGQAEFSLGSGEVARAHRVFNQIDISDFDRGTRARYWYSRGLAASQLSLWNEATFCYLRASSLDENATYLAQLAYSLEFEARYDEAILAFEELVDLEPANQNYRLSLAYLYYQEGHYTEAESTMRYLASLEPLDSRYLEGQAFSAEHQFDWQSAESAYGQLIALDDEYYSESNKVAAKRRLKTLENDWSFQFTDLVRLDQSPQSDDGSPIPFASYSGFFSLGTSYRIYHRGGEVKLIGRLYGTNQESDLFPENETIQAALGLNYKPFYSQNLIFSAERIFALNQYEDDWLIRASYSMDHNTFWQSSDAPDHWYYSVYADVARYTETSQDYLTLNARLGRRYYFQGSSWAWQPYLTGGWANNDDETRTDLGLGLGLLGFSVDSERYWKRVSHQLSLEGRFVIDGSTPEDYTVRLLYELAY